ncbi:SEFIR domain-containing protein [Pseudomonas moraviensis]|uniref:SEFIR domain-containing protein n=1 Tax=Pseudomonas moraviensis TaxID=321662 RepID=UPI0022C8F189|nr:SEFIR domain-containing protein [Pseudomonas moraviensis]GLH40092.1 hypothetical protein RS1P1_43760 [Pseudomonas moraviensis]
MISPKVFISYSWSSEEHESWVLNFAEQLMQAGVDTVLDKWELLPTHDAAKFMERMVNDPTINKVLMICDETYARKANERGATGVSTETQIISPAIYAGTSPEKFVAILTQRDDSGRPYVPTYYSSKIFIDFSNPTKESESFEELVRFIYGKPRYKRPELGKPPAYLDDAETLTLGTTITFNRAVSALRDGKPYAEGAVEEYFTSFLKNLSVCKISFADLNGEAKLNATTDSLSALLPYRNEMIQLFEHVARYSPSPQYISHVHKFFESFTNFLFFQGVGRSTDWDFDNYKFLGKELFLYFTALMIKHDRLESLSEFLSLSYYIKADNHEYGKKITDHSIFSWSINSLIHKNQVQKLGKTNLAATIINERSGAAGILFDDLLQADILLFIRALVNRQTIEDSVYPWYPDTAVYIGYHPTPLELFARASSAKYFDRVKKLVGLEKSKIESLSIDAENKFPKFGWQTLPVRILLGVDKLASRP